jgi:hypothetical protein
MTPLMVMTRPDIAFAVNQVSQYCQNPGPGHWNGVKRILVYLPGTPNHGLLFKWNIMKNLSLDMLISDKDFNK